MKVFSPNKQTSSKPKVTVWHIIKAFILGFIAAMAFIAVKTVPQALHNEWLKLGSGYDVEYEYLYANILRKTREGAYFLGISPDGHIDELLGDWQKKNTDDAFKKIPEGDGERIIWQIWQNTDLLSKIDDKEYAPKLVPVLLDYFEGLSSRPMASKWADKIDRFKYLNIFCVYFFKNYSNSGLSPEKSAMQLRSVLKAMDQLSPSIDPKLFIAQSKKDKVLPLTWENTVLISAQKSLGGIYGHLVECDAQIKTYMQNSIARLNSLYDFYQPHMREVENTNMLGITKHAIQNFTKNNELIDSHCKK